MSVTEFQEHLASWGTVWAGGISIGIGMNMLFWFLFWSGRAVTEFLRIR